MSPNVNSFVHDLVAMAKAMEEVPALESRIRELNEALESAQAHNQGLEQNIQSYKSQIESLQTKNHDLEVARDDAEYRFLELDEKSHKVLGNFQAILSLAQAARDDLDPPKPTPEPTPAPVQEPEAPRPMEGSAWDELGTIQATAGQSWAGPTPQGQSDPHPTASSTQTTQSLSAPTTSADSPNTASQSHGENPDYRSQPQLTPMPTAEGQSASLPSGEGSSTSAVSQPSPTPHSGRYAGKRYYDNPTYVPRAEWLAEGGTDEDYDWRPASRQSAE